jgi:hypothetical protein
MILVTRPMTLSRRDPSWTINQHLPTDLAFKSFPLACQEPLNTDRVTFSGQAGKTIRKAIISQLYLKDQTCNYCKKPYTFDKVDLHHTNPEDKEFTLSEKTLDDLYTINKKKGEGLFKNNKVLSRRLAMEKTLRMAMEEAKKVVPMHPECHRQYHQENGYKAPKATVAQPKENTLSLFPKTEGQTPKTENTSREDVIEWLAEYSKLNPKKPF